ncbi:hypothetical protein KFE25_000623 [Diacronema lutheri]|uniref:Uncharacterized protein n=2 Tax=Diacronema lutheri TaxID=2081491 RepID=A0A8J5XRU9_DIALT|nr:hypothetical protein KFE25_000623 [Diacronema lutheri]
MLYADKAALANRARLRMLQIRERELNLYIANSRVIATKSTLLCGIAYSALLYVKMDYYQGAHWFTRHVYPVALVILLGFSLLALMNFSLIAMLGPGLALRGPDGSVAIALDAIAIEYRTASFFFAIAIVSVHAVVITYAFGKVARRTSAAVTISVILTMLSVYSLHLLYHHAMLIGERFRIDEVHTGAFTGPSDARPDSDSSQGARERRADGAAATLLASETRQPTRGGDSAR